MLGRNLASRLPTLNKPKRNVDNKTWQTTGVLLLHKILIVVSTQAVILLQFNIVSNKKLLYLDRIWGSSYDEIFPQICVNESRQKTWKTRVKKLIYLVKLQVATFLKMSAPTSIFHGLCLFQKSQCTFKNIVFQRLLLNLMFYFYLVKRYYDGWKLNF